MPDVALLTGRELDLKIDAVTYHSITVTLIVLGKGPDVYPITKAERCRKFAALEHFDSCVQARLAPSSPPSLCPSSTAAEALELAYLDACHSLIGCWSSVYPDTPIAARQAAVINHVTARLLVRTRQEPFHVSPSSSPSSPSHLYIPPPSARQPTYLLATMG